MPILYRGANFCLAREKPTADICCRYRRWLKDELSRDLANQADCGASLRKTDASLD